MTTFAERLVKARLARGFSQHELSVAAELSGGTSVSRYERGGSPPRTETTARIAKALNVSFAWLATGIGPRKIVRVARRSSPSEIKVGAA